MKKRPIVRVWQASLVTVEEVAKQFADAKIPLQEGAAAKIADIFNRKKYSTADKKVIIVMLQTECAKHADVSDVIKNFIYYADKVNIRLVAELVNVGGKDMLKMIGALRRREMAG
ncbi:MAG: hypothetical protein M3R00_04175, partial [Pseudomonadota bacterium]|nr:hypothetical protein [Pseudomonadota bacterium]